MCVSLLSISAKLAYPDVRPCFSADSAKLQYHMMSEPVSLLSSNSAKLQYPKIAKRVSLLSGQSAKLEYPDVIACFSAVW